VISGDIKGRKHLAGKPAYAGISFALQEHQEPTSMGSKIFLFGMGFCTCIVSIWQIMSGFRTGVFWGQNVTKFHISRRTDPAIFWSQIIFLSIFLLLGAGLMVWSVKMLWAAGGQLA
jgi:hypothetical protein